jgi:hypothetical protein
VVDHHDEPHMNGKVDPVCHPLSMWGDLGMNSYARWITFGSARLIHIHQNQWAHEPTKTTSTSINLLIQALTYYHLAKTIGL